MAGCCAALVREQKYELELLAKSNANVLGEENAGLKLCYVMPCYVIPCF